METRIYVSFLYQICICFFIQSFENNTLPNAIWYKYIHLFYVLIWQEENIIQVSFWNILKHFV